MYQIKDMQCYVTNQTEDVRYLIYIKQEEIKSPIMVDPTIWGKTCVADCICFHSDKKQAR